ncbi:MAG: flagellar biosynthesis protein FliQ [Pseudomonadota bacterium]
MTVQFVVSLAKEAVETTLLVSAPMLLAGLVIGLLVSIFQAVTQIQEMTLAFVPKILAVLLALLVFFPWMLATLVSFTAKLIKNIPNYVG